MHLILKFSQIYARIFGDDRIGTKQKTNGEKGLYTKDWGNRYQQVIPLEPSLRSRE